MNILTPESAAERFEAVGLNKETLEGVDLYTLDISTISDIELTELKEILELYKVALEIGYGNQLDSLLFAANKSQSEIVIGIDANNFDLSKIKKMENSNQDQKPTILLLKGDIWNDAKKIDKLLKCDSSNKEERIPSYSQVIAPDSDYIDIMIGATLSRSKEHSMIVIDSGGVENLKLRQYPENSIQTKILHEAGITGNSHLDWIKYWLRKMECTEISKENYEKGVDEGKYPQTSCLRDGNMLVFQN
ncbi:MAG: hypothetical protein WC806_03130 [Candidatus Gracilibacteria bacterium]|jgi:hypothetical protein